MKITISSTDLKESLGIASNTLGSNSDITKHFIFTTEGTGVNVMACSPPRQFSKIPLIGATVQESGSFSIEGEKILKAVGAVEGALDLSFDEETKEINFKSGFGDGTFSSLDPESFPPWNTKLSEATLVKSISSSVLYDTLNSLKTYVSTDESRRPELSMLVIEGGKAMACDGFMLGISRNDELNGLDLKIHQKDIAPLQKFLKAYDGNAIEILNGDQSTFFRAEDGAAFGVMDLPYTFPPMTAQYADAFEWTPRRVWRLSKENFLKGLTFLTAFVDKTNLKVTFKDPEDESLLPPQILMNGGGNPVSYNLQVPEFDFDDGTDINTITDLGDKMYATRLREAGEGEDIPSFDFNYMSIKKVLDSQDNIMVFGCSRESKRGYMLFKSEYSSGVQSVAIVSWMV